MRVHPVRRLFGLLVVPVLLASVAGCGLFSSTPGPEEVTRGFLGAFAGGDTGGAARSTDNANAAKPLLDKVREALRPTSLSTTVDQVRSSGGNSNIASASFTATWNLGGDRTWSYQGSLDLRREGGTWKVHWTPAVIHPKLSVQQTIVLRELQPDPAPVLDRDGTPLLAPEKVVSVAVDRRQVGDLPTTAEALVTALSGFDAAITRQAVVDGVGKVKDGQTYTVANLRDSDYQQVKAQIHDLPGVRFISRSRLLAPDRAFATQVLPGIRKSVEDKVAGRAGWRIVTVTTSGAEVEELFTKAAEPARAITATLSRTVQTAAAAAVDPVQVPAVLVAIQPSTGEVLAVAQNTPADTQGSLALSGRFPPGSTFKIVTASAAIQTGAVTVDTPAACPATTTIEGRVVPNENQFDLGSVPLHTAFAKSCNTTFAQLAAGLPADALTSAARQLGIGVDFVLPAVTTVTGSVPPATNTVERAEDGFGQGKVLASPFGMALAAATVVRGSMPTPTLLRGVPTRIDASPPPIPPVVLDSLRQMMREVVTDGTAVRIRDVSDAAGKTGTAQFGDGSNSHGWFVGYRGDLAFAVLLVGAGTSTPAVDVAGIFLRALG